MQHKICIVLGFNEQNDIFEMNNLKVMSLIFTNIFSVQFIATRLYAKSGGKNKPRVGEKTNLVGRCMCTKHATIRFFSLPFLSCGTHKK